MADEITYPKTKTGQGLWKPIKPDSIEVRRDDYGFTHPNLHRGKSTATDTQERNISVGVYGLESYRTTETAIHDEDSRDSEIP